MHNDTALLNFVNRIYLALRRLAFHSSDWVHDNTNIAMDQDLFEELYDYARHNSLNVFSVDPLHPDEVKMFGFKLIREDWYPENRDKIEIRIQVTSDAQTT